MLSIKRFYVELDDGYEPDSVKVSTMQLIDQHKVIAIAGNAGTPMAAIAAPLANVHRQPERSACHQEKSHAG
ncbi:MAG: hypothetical protein LZF84_06735 [Nitrosomonas sp.]|nr:MAG: hypothetical protein LZF84_06735 [Nitrosomonas sp.]